MTSDDPVGRFLHREEAERNEEARAQAARSQIVAAFPGEADRLVTVLAAEVTSAAARLPEFSVENVGHQTASLSFRGIRLVVRPFEQLGSPPTALKVILTRATGDLPSDREVLAQDRIDLEVAPDGFRWGGYTAREFASRSIEQILEASRQ